MDEGLKKRLIGATVLVSLVVIFVPMLLEEEPVVTSGIYSSNVPLPPKQQFADNLVPGENENLAKMPAVERPEVVPLKSAVTPSQNSIAKVERGGTTSQPAEPPAKQSEAPAPVKPREGLSAWVVQVGSFSNRENAQKLVDDLRKKKFSAFLEQAEVNGKIHYRVKVGPEVNKGLAEQMLSALDNELKPLELKGKLQSYP